MAARKPALTIVGIVRVVDAVVIVYLFNAMHFGLGEEFGSRAAGQRQVILSQRVLGSHVASGQAVATVNATALRHPLAIDNWQVAGSPSQRQLGCFIANTTGAKILGGLPLGKHLMGVIRRFTSDPQLGLGQIEIGLQVIDIAQGCRPYRLSKHIGIRPVGDIGIDQRGTT